MNKNSSTDFLPGFNKLFRGRQRTNSYKKAAADFQKLKEKTFDEMRKERHEQRRAAQKESIQKLFANAV